MTRLVVPGGWGRVRASRPALAAAVFAVAFGAVALMAAARPASDRFADLEVYRSAVRAQLHGGGLYDYRRGNGDGFNYPPFAALVLVPFAVVSAVAAAVVWCAMSAAALALLVRTALRAWRPAISPTWLWLAAALAAVSAPTLSNVRFGQASLLVTTLVVVDVVRPQARWSGVGVGVAAAIKLTPLLFVAYLLATGARSGARRAVLAFGVATAVAAAVWPTVSARYWGASIAATADVPDAWSAGNQSAAAMLARAGTTGSLFTVLWPLAGVIAATIAVVRARALTAAGDRVAGVTLVGCAVILAAPLSWTHAQFWLLGLCCVTVGRSPVAQRAWVTLVLVVTMLPLATLASGLPRLLSWVAVDARGLLAAAALVAVRARQPQA